MRTTLTLEDDVAIQIHRLQKEKGARWKTLVNEALRLGLIQMEKAKNPVRQEAPTHPRKLGRCKFNVISVSEALALAGGSSFR